MKKLAFLLLLSSTVAHSAFEAIDCGWDGIFENPSRIGERRIETVWVQSFGLLPYVRLSCSGLRGFGLGVSSFGNKLYRENEILVGYAWSKETTKIGVSFRGMNLSVLDCDPAFAVGVDIGMNLQVTPYLDFNLSMHNLNFPEICDEEVPRRVLGGFVVRLGASFVSELQVYKESIYQTEIRIRNEFSLSELMSVGVGFKTYPSSFAVGALLRYKRIGFSYYTRTHRTLGLTHIIGIEMKGRDAKERREDRK
jgi:hypothetical protein